MLLKPNDNSAPFVAKIDDHKLLNDEMLRFRTFIEPWQGQLKPELYIHHGVAVIFFTMIDGAGDQNKPAPTLHKRVTSLSTRERNVNAKNCAAIEDILHTISRAIDRLACPPHGGASRLGSQLPSARHSRLGQRLHRQRENQPLARVSLSVLLTFGNVEQSAQHRLKIFSAGRIITCRSW